MIQVLILVVALTVTFGCDGSQQQSSGEEKPFGPSTTTSVSEPPPLSTQQPSPQAAQGRAPPQRYEGLEVGEPAKFENGLIPTVEGATIVQVPVALRGRLEPNDRLVTVRFGMENATQEGQTSSRTFNVTTALWQAWDQNGNLLETLYPLETSLVAGELPNPNPGYPYLGWQGELRPGQERQGSMLFVAPPSTTKMWVVFTHPVMGPPPFGEWELGAVSELPQAP